MAEKPKSKPQNHPKPPRKDASEHAGFFRLEARARFKNVRS